MLISVGTFNLNNLFSRYNFKGEIKAIKDFDTTLNGEVAYEFTPADTWKIRTYRGGLVNAKKLIDTERIAARIKTIDIDVLAIQEVEDIDTIHQFNREYLNWMYPYITLVEGNDPRLIDIGLLSKLPLGGITSWQNKVHPNDPDKTVFGRDLLQVDILNSSRTKKLFTIFNNHLKSHYVDFTEDPNAGEASNNKRRTQQAEMITEIVKDQTRPNSNFIVLGDMNDPPNSPCLQSFTEDQELQLTNSLENPKETRPAKDDDPPPQTTSWTHRYKKSNQPAEYELYDQIWISPKLSSKLKDAWIDRRRRHLGDGSDHDPAWIILDM
ncbi:MAG: endonuclease/exonuclease/phosphatase family protein [Candidatus Bathyarchaeota archaeon]